MSMRSGANKTDRCNRNTALLRNVDIRATAANYMGGRLVVAVKDINSECPSSEILNECLYDGHFTLAHLNVYKKQK